MVKLTQVKARSFGLKCLKLFYFQVSVWTAIYVYFWCRSGELWTRVLCISMPVAFKLLLLIIATPSFSPSLLFSSFLFFFFKSFLKSKTHYNVFCAAVRIHWSSFARWPLAGSPGCRGTQAYFGLATRLGAIRCVRLWVIQAPKDRDAGAFWGSQLVSVKVWLKLSFSQGLSTFPP